MQADHAALAQLLGGHVSLSMYLWAAVVLNTRALATKTGHALCSIIDLAGHLSFGATAEVQPSPEGDGAIS